MQQRGQHAGLLRVVPARGAHVLTDGKHEVEGAIVECFQEDFRSSVGLVLEINALQSSVLGVGVHVPPTVLGQPPS